MLTFANERASGLPTLIDHISGTVNRINKNIT